MKRLIFTVTNDLSYDQRMQRICTTLQNNGYHVTLVGRKLSTSRPLQDKSYTQERLNCFFNNGFLFYAEYNLRLLLYLLFKKSDLICAIDLDTILPVYITSILSGKIRLYDAHELFTEQKEIVTRPIIKKLWNFIEGTTVPNFKFGYTVNQFLKDEFQRKYKVNYAVIRNLPQFNNSTHIEAENNKPYLVYQGAINEGRSFETLIPAMKKIPLRLKIFGSGNFLNKLKELIQINQLQNKVELHDPIEPEKLKPITANAFAGLMLFEDTGLNQYQSLANRYFDYIMAGIPQVCVNYPQYKLFNDEFNIALMINDTEPGTIACAVNTLINNKQLYETLQENTNQAQKSFKLAK